MQNLGLFFFNGKYVHLSVKRPAKRQTNQEGERRIFKLEREPTTIAGSFDLHKNHTKCRYMGMRKERIRGWDPRSSHPPSEPPQTRAAFSQGFSAPSSSSLQGVWPRLKSSQPFFSFFFFLF